MERDNYYLLLSLPFDPPEVNSQKIKSAIELKKNEWSAMRNHPSKGRLAQMYLGYVPDMLEVLVNDPAKRNDEALGAKKIDAENQKKLFEDLDRDVRIISQKGYVNTKEIAALLKRYPGLSEIIIKKRISVEIREEKKKSEKKATLDPSLARTISDNLNIIGNKSLYEFLGLAPTSSLKSLLDKAGEIENELRKKSNKDAQLTASQGLIGHCKTIFAKNETRDKYDVTLAQAKLSDLDKNIEAAGLDEEVDPNEFDALITVARKMGLSMDESRDYILEYCNKKKWRVILPSTFSVENMRQCGVCGYVNAAKALKCASCGFDLDIKCPKCGRSISMMEKMCSGCSFPVGDMPNALDTLKQAKIALAKNDGKNAERFLRETLIYWPDHPEAKNELAKLEKLKDDLRFASKELNDQIAKKNFYGARNSLSKLKHLDPAHPDLALEKTIVDKIALSESHVQKAKAAKNNDDVIDAYSRALDECADNKEAIDGLAKSPPDPPKTLNASISHRSISIKWSPCSSKGKLEYVIVRKENSQPSAPNDGEKLVVTNQLEFDDVATIGGVFYYYAVYSMRGSVVSASAAIAGPAMRLAEAENLSVVSGDSTNHISWTISHAARGVEVWRKENAKPSSKGDGIQVAGARRDGITDSGLKNGHLYYYLITVAYKDKNGTDVYSTGLTISGHPIAPPKPIVDIIAEKSNNFLYLRWTTPERGSPLLFISGKDSSYKSGSLIAADQLARLGKKMVPQAKNEGRLEIDFQGAIYIIPVTAEGNTFVVGHSTIYTSIDEVRNLRCKVASQKMYLEWDWPAGAQKVLISYKHDNYPQGPADQDASLTEVTTEMYNRESAFVISKPGNKSYFFIAYVIAQTNGNVQAFSQGAKIFATCAEPMEMPYEIKIHKSIFGKIKGGTLVLKVPYNAVLLPEMTLVKKRGNIPIKQSDGTVILKIKGGAVTEKTITYDLPETVLEKNSYAKLFFCDESQYQFYRLLNPAKERLGLG